MVQKFNVGADAVLQIVTQAGGLLKPAILTMFTYKQVMIDLKSRPINGRVIHRKIPDGWEGSFDFDRSGPELDDYFAQSEDDYYAGLGDAQVFLIQTVREVHGGISQYRFNEVAMILADGGSWKQDDKVTQKIDWVASARKKVI